MDNCGESGEVIYTDSTSPGPCLTEYFIHRTWRVDDLCGNSSTCLQEIAVSGGCLVDLALTKSLAIGQSMNINPGDNVNFTLRITNNGNISIRSVTVVDYIPIGFTLNDPDWFPTAFGSTAKVLLKI
jgi:uncharacterized repeat protein (TIGR01451 family)